jgi:hypothetical protein
MNNGQTLSGLLQANQLDTIKEHCRKNSVEFSTIERIKPVYLSILLANTEPAAHGNKNLFLDEYFQKSAIGQQKKIFGLESISEQLEVFDKISYEHQAFLLMKSLASLPEYKAQNEVLMQRYLAADLEGLLALEFNFSLPDSMYQNLMTIRNWKMAYRIQQLLVKQSTFIAVGAGHLGGEQGLISILKHFGYTVEPVPGTYRNYMADGWYRKKIQAAGIEIEFPGRPEWVKGTVQKWEYHSDGISYQLFISDSLNSISGMFSQIETCRQIEIHFLSKPAYHFTCSTEKEVLDRFPLRIRNSEAISFTRNGMNFLLLAEGEKKLNKEMVRKYFQSCRLIPN